MSNEPLSIVVCLPDGIELYDPIVGKNAQGHRALFTQRFDKSKLTRLPRGVEQPRHE